MSCDQNKKSCEASFLHACEKAMNRRQALALVGSVLASSLVIGCDSGGNENEKLGACVGAGKGLGMPAAAGNLKVGEAGIYPDAANPQFVIARDEKGFMAMKNYCTHAGGDVTIQSDKTYVCNLHGSRFGFDGALITGPATRPLDHVAMCRRTDGALVVDKTTVLPNLTTRVT